MRVPSANRITTLKRHEKWIQQAAYRSLYIIKFQILFGLKENIYFINLNIYIIFNSLKIKEWHIYCLTKLTPMNLKIIHRFKLWLFVAFRGKKRLDHDFLRCKAAHLAKNTRMVFRSILQAVTLLYLEDCGSRSLRNDGKNLPKYTAPYLRRT